MSEIYSGEGEGVTGSGSQNIWRLFKEDKTLDQTSTQSTYFLELFIIIPLTLVILNCFFKPYFGWNYFSKSNEIMKYFSSKPRWTSCQGRAAQHILFISDLTTMEKCQRYTWKRGEGWLDQVVKIFMLIVWRLRYQFCMSQFYFYFL